MSHVLEIKMSTAAESHIPLQIEDGAPVTTHSQVERPRELTTADANVRVFATASEVKPVTDASLEPLQEWEGVVEWVEDGQFGARLTDITAPGEDEYGDFTLDEVSEDDAHLVVPGGVFYWTIARETSSWGQRRHTSMIRFRRLPAVRAARRVDVRKEAEWMVEELGLGPDSTDAAVA